MEQITLTVAKIGETEIDSEDRIFQVARMLNIRSVGGVGVFEFPFRDGNGLEKLETVTVDDTFDTIQDLIDANVATTDVQTLSATGAQALTISSRFTEIDGVTTQATGNRTLNLTVEAFVPAGARLLVRSKTAGTETTIFGTAIDAPTITGEAGKTFVQEFIYNGTTFYAAGTAVKID